VLGAGEGTHAAGEQARARLWRNGRRCSMPDRGCSHGVELPRTTAGGTFAHMSVVVILASGNAKHVPAPATATLTVGPDGGLQVSFTSVDGPPSTATWFSRGQWQKAWLQPDGTNERLQYVAI